MNRKYKVGDKLVANVGGNLENDSIVKLGKTYEVLDYWEKQELYDLDNNYVYSEENLDKWFTKVGEEETKTEPTLVLDNIKEAVIEEIWDYKLSIEARDEATWKKVTDILLHYGFPADRIGYVDGCNYVNYYIDTLDQSIKLHTDKSISTEDFLSLFNTQEETVVEEQKEELYTVEMKNSRLIITSLTKDEYEEVKKTLEDCAFVQINNYLIPCEDIAMIIEGE